MKNVLKELKDKKIVFLEKKKSNISWWWLVFIRNLDNLMVNDG